MASQYEFLPPSSSTSAIDRAYVGNHGYFINEPGLGQPQVGRRITAMYFVMHEVIWLA